jgi:hypothetical protein
VAQISFPESDYNSGVLTEAEWERVASRYTDDGVDGNPSQSAVVTAGVGLSVSIAANCRGQVRGFNWETDGTGDSLEIAANSSGSTRVDWVCLRLDRSTWAVRAVVKQGTPGAGSPALLRQDSSAGGTVWEVPLALVSIPNGASSVSVTRYEQYIGSRITPCTSSTRPVLPRRGDTIHETDTGRWLGWDGSSWRVIYSDSGVVVVNGTASPWSVNVDTVLEHRSGVVCLRLGAFERTGGNLPGGTDSRLPVAIPSAYRHPNRDQHGTIYVTGSSAGAGRVTVYASNNTSGRAGEIWLTNHAGVNSGTSVTGSSISWVVG